MRAIDPPDPGLYPGIPDHLYHSWRGASASRLKVLDEKTPAHLKQEMDNPSPSTDAQVIGSATHMAVLEPELFESRYLREIEGDGRKKEIREARAEQAQNANGHEILKAAHYDLCIRLRDQVSAHPYAQKLLGGQTERSAVWVDRDSGVTCKARFDLISDRVPALVDLKTTQDASPSEFEKSIWRYRYHMQAAHYLEGARQLGCNVDHFIFVAIEKDPPYCLALYRLEDGALRAGGDQLRPLLELWAECERTGEWPGYPQEVKDISLPTYAWSDLDDFYDKRRAG